MTNHDNEARARQYLLGELSDEECSTLEQEYFIGADALDDVAAAEDVLIEDYLAGNLTGLERERFERHYLSTAAHRTRVETVRRLIDVAKSAPGLATRSSSRWWSAPNLIRTRGFQALALAAVLLLAVAGTVWIAVRARDRGQGTGEQPPTASSTSPPPGPVTTPDQPAGPRFPSARVVAFSISPVAVRGGDESATLVIPSGSEIVALHLEGEANDKPLGRARATVRTVSGEQAWQGAPTVAGDLPAGVVARLEVPAAALPVDDYFIELWEIDVAGVERERYRYFLRVRSR